MAKARFRLGRLVSTPGALQRVPNGEMLRAIGRHVCGGGTFVRRDTETKSGSRLAGASHLVVHDRGWRDLPPEGGRQVLINGLLALVQLRLGGFGDFSARSSNADGGASGMRDSWRLFAYAASATPGGSSASEEYVRGKVEPDPLMVSTARH